MQIPALGSGTSTAPRRLNGEAAQAVAARATSPLLPGEVETELAVPRGGLRTLDAQLNQQMAGAQQALGFLDQISGRLHGLKASLSGKLAERSVAGRGGQGNGRESGQSGSDAQLDNQIRQFGRLWQLRERATAGTLDGRLAFGEPGSSAQAFRIRGLDRDALAGGERERLSFSIGGRQTSVLVDPAQGDEAMLQRLDQALAATGIRVTQDARGRPLFATAESRWPEVRDGLAIKGEGQRFPAGQFNRVRSEAEPDAIRPQTWQADDVPTTRQTLQEVINALDTVRRARDTVSQALADASSRLRATEDESTRAEAAWAGEFAEHFKALGDRPTFDVFAAIAPALISVSRQRVMSLLSLE